MPRRRTTALDYERRILRAQQLVEARLDESLDPSDVAKAAHLSIHHFHRIFRAQMGETVMQHVRRLRLERAARKLRGSDLRILDLAIEAGYESHEAFTRAFVDRFGVAPSIFREQASSRLAAWEPTRATAPKCEVRVETFPSLRVAFIRHRGGYVGIGETWQRLRTWATSRALLREEPTLYGVCPDDPEVTDEALLRFDACVLVGDDFHDPDVGIATIPGGTYAVGMHVGPYERLSETYLDVIGRWLPTSDYEPAIDPVVEHYIDDPSRTQASELRTEVRVRLED